MSSKISRRQLAVGAVAGAAFAQTSGVSDYPDLKNPGLDPVAWTKQRYDSAPLRLTFKAGNRKDAEAWQKKLRPKIVELRDITEEAGFALRERLAIYPEFTKDDRFVREACRPAIDRWTDGTGLVRSEEQRW